MSSLQPGLPLAELALRSPSVSSRRASSCCEPSSAAAALAADKMVELIGGEGEVAVIAHDQTSRTGIDRVKGFTDQKISFSFFKWLLTVAS